MVKGEARVLWVRELFLGLDSWESGGLSCTVELVEEEESVIVNITAVIEISWICNGWESDVILILGSNFRWLLDRSQFLTFSLSLSHLVLQNRALALIHISFHILGKLLVNPIGNILFLLLFVALVFADQWIITIFDHMLSSGLMQKWDDLGPFLSVLTDKLKNDEILVSSPVSMYFVAVKMVEPSLPAVLRWPEDGPVGDIEHFLGDLVPFAGFLLSDDVDKKVIFLLSPCYSFLGGQKVQILKFQKLGFLVEEDRGKLIPKCLCLRITKKIRFVDCWVKENRYKRW